MRTVLLVDDEEIIRRGIATMVPWADCGLTLVHTATNGKDALEYLLHHKADITITDIKMPLMDGIELIEQCIRHKIPTRFIVLTGFDEFEYARSVMRYGVRHYLLKPCDESQIVRACCELCSDLDAREAKEWEVSNLTQGATQNFLQQLILTGQPSRRDRDYFAPLINPSGVAFHLVLFQCEEGEALLDFALSNIAQELFAESYLYHVILPEHIVVFLIHGSPDGIRATAERAAGTMEQYYKVRFTCTVTDRTTLTEIGHTYWDAMENRACFKSYQDTCLTKLFQVVEDELGNPALNLKWIAQNRLYMNENYLSKLFIKLTGQKFTHYLTKRRVEKAKALIRENPSIKYSELCDKLGFSNNPAYFSTLFKNQTGRTLTEYRQSVRPK